MENYDDTVRRIWATYRLTHCVRCRAQMAVRKGLPAIFCESCRESGSQGEPGPGNGDRPGSPCGVG